MRHNVNISPRMRALAAVLGAIAIAVVWAAWTTSPASRPGNAEAADSAPRVSLLATATDRATTSQVAAIRDRVAEGSDTIVPDGSTKALRLTTTPAATLNAWPGPDGLKCFELYTGSSGSSSTGCVTDEYISTGFVVFSKLDPSTNGKYVVAGLAPDGVASVDLDGKTLPVRSNVYSTTSDKGPQTVSWTSTDGTTKTTTLGLR